MADSDAKPKKSKHPYGAWIWGGVAAALTFRALYHPWRALIKDGFPASCAGDSACNPAMQVNSFSGLSEVYAPVRGTIAVAKSGVILLMPADQAVVLEYTGDPSALMQQVKSGDVVGAGQQIALASVFSFAVWQLQRTASGQAQMGAAIEPASWLATHGIKISATYHKNQTTWCGAGRKLVVPQTIASQCNITLPAPTGYALLPISATMA
jgi:hypothetical protein